MNPSKEMGDADGKKGAGRDRKRGMHHDDMDEGMKMQRNEWTFMGDEF